MEKKPARGRVVCNIADNKVRTTRRNIASDFFYASSSCPREDLVNEEGTLARGASLPFLWGTGMSPLRYLNPCLTPSGLLILSLCALCELCESPSSSKFQSRTECRFRMPGYTGRWVVSTFPLPGTNGGIRSKRARSLRLAGRACLAVARARSFFSNRSSLTSKNRPSRYNL